MERPGKTVTYWGGLLHISPDAKMRTFQPHTEPQEERLSRGIASAFLFHKMRQSVGRPGENICDPERAMSTGFTSIILTKTRSLAQDSQSDSRGGIYQKFLLSQAHSS